MRSHAHADIHITHNMRKKQQNTYVNYEVKKVEIILRSREQQFRKHNIKTAKSKLKKDNAISITDRWVLWGCNTSRRPNLHRWRWGCQPYSPAPFHHQEDSWYAFLLEAESTPPFGEGGRGVEWNGSHYWPIVLAPDDGWCWVCSSRWNAWQGKPKCSEKTCASAAFFTTNPTGPVLEPRPPLWETG
jgi:hypothetical protein